MADGDAISGPSAASDLATAPPANPAEAGFPAWSAELRRFVVGVVRDPGLADDVIQATYLKTVQRGHEARAESAKGWVFRVALREALAARRGDAARDRAHRRLADLPPADPSPSPDAPLIRAEQAIAVRAALARLTEDQRRVVVARIYGEQPFRVIAEDLNLPLGTVLTRMRRALDALRRALSPNE